MMVFKSIEDVASWSSTRLRGFENPERLAEMLAVEAYEWREFRTMSGYVLKKKYEDMDNWWDLAHDLNVRTLPEGDRYTLEIR